MRATIRASVCGKSEDSLRANLVDAPILWIARWVRDCLDTGYLELDKTVREGIGFEYHLSVLWDATLPLDSAREVTGAELLTQPFYAADVVDALKALEARWEVSVGELNDENYSIMFRSRDTYRSFHDEVLGLAEPDPKLKADVLDLLRPEAEFDDPCRTHVGSGLRRGRHAREGPRHPHALAAANSVRAQWPPL